MPGTTKALTLCTLAALVAVTAYSVGFGVSTLLWSGWAVLGLVAAVSGLVRRR